MQTENIEDEVFKARVSKIASMIARENVRKAEKDLRIKKANRAKAKQQKKARRKQRG